MKTNIILGLTTALAVTVQAGALNVGQSGMNANIPEQGVGLVTNLSVLVPDDGKMVLDLNVTLDLGNAVGDTVWNGDLYLQLTHVDPFGNSQMAVLLNRVGRGQGGLFDVDGYGPNGFQIVFDDQALTDIHWYGASSPSFNGAGQLIGSWAPDGRLLDPSAAPASFVGAARPAQLGVFSNTTADGMWYLYMYDAAGGFVSQLNGWQLNFDLLPEPSSAAMLAGAGLVAALGWGMRRFRNRRS
jgi:hypothetical protein